jgi:uncharacterized protein (TIGR02594 family)
MNGANSKRIMKMTIRHEWYEVAYEELSTKEKPGIGDNPRVIEYHKETSLKATKDSVPWCSSFISWVLEKSGLNSTRSAWARSYLKWGISLRNPVLDCIVILERGKNSGHVGILHSFDIDKQTVTLLGGNQADSVCIKTFPMSRVLGYRWPHEIKLPADAVTKKALAAHA